MTTAWQQFESAFMDSLEKEGLIKITMSAYKGADDLKNIYIKPVLIKAAPKLSFTYRYKTRDIVKNYDFDEALSQINLHFSTAHFNIINLFSLEQDAELSINKKGQSNFVKRKASQSKQANSKHDKEKQRKIQTESKSYLQALNITDATGNVFKNAQDKYKQINHYIEILSSTLNSFPDGKTIQVADMGSGKGYLTFALYDFLNNELKKPASITGVEYRQDMVELCNQIASTAHFDQLNFVQGVIADYEPEALDILIALHACDTATDDAIAKGIKNNASLIVVAPCCHKQIRKQMKSGQANEQMNFIIKYGLFLERQAEMITDSLRSLILEYYGYQTKVVDFISDLHTPKNVLIIAQKKKDFKPMPKEKFEQQLQEIKTFWGIEQHYLESLVL